MRAWRRRSKSVEASRFLATSLCHKGKGCAGVHEPQELPKTPRVFAGRGLGGGEASGVGLERVLVEQDGEVRVTRPRHVAHDHWLLVG